MKIGYSILLGEILEANTIDYDDCRNLQVVCPECREPVFKGVRTHQDEETHYLSHYDKKVAYSADCENRVGGITHQQIAEDNTDARKQRLQHFLSLLPNLLDKDPIFQRGLEASHKKMDKSASFRLFRDFCYQAVDQAPVDEVISECITDYRASLKESGWGLATTFSQHIQERIASDMYRTLVRPIARRNRDRLFSCAFLHVSNSFAQDIDHSAMDKEVIGRIFWHMNELLTRRNKKHAENTVMQMMTERLPTGYNRTFGQALSDDDAPSSYFMRVGGLVQDEMFQLLVQLPYYEMLHSKYSDPSKEYPYVSGIEPVSEDEKIRVGRNLH